MLNKNIVFISKDAAWQKYRLDVLTKLGEKYDSEIVVLTTGNLKDYIKPNKYVKYISFINIFPQNAKPNFFPGSLFYLIKNKPDAILCLNNATQLTEYFALILSKIFRIKFIWWTHGYDHDTQGRNRILKKIKKKYSLFFLKFGDKIITFSDGGQNYLSKFINDDKIIVAHNTLDTVSLIEKYNYLKYNFTKEQVRKEIALENDDFVLLFSGRLNIKKKVDDAIKVVKSILNEGPNIKFIIIGDGEEKKNLEQLAGVYVNDRIIFTCSIFDENLLAKYFYSSDLFLMPGYVGLAIIHAFSFGLPLITADVDNHSPEIEYLQNDKNGYMIKKNDLKNMEEKILFLMNNHSELERMSENAKIFVRNKGNINLMISKMAKAIF